MRVRAAHLTLAVVLAAAATLSASLVALAAGTGTIDPPPRIAFVARSDNPADALAVGPTAGQLGAPVFVTAPGSLVPSTQAGLIAYAPELVIIAGGNAAIAPAVEQAIEAALGLPDDQVVRASGTDRHETAVKISELLAAHDPAFLPVDATATDSDLLDGKDSTAFLGKSEKAADASHADDADTVAGARPLGAMVDQNGSLLASVGATSAARLGVGKYVVTFDRSIKGCVRVATAGALYDDTHAGEIHWTEVAASLDPEDRTVFVATSAINQNGYSDRPFHLLVLC